MERSLSSPFTLNPPRTQWLTRLPTVLKRWQLNARTRRQLAALDERLLADAGISRSERFAELGQPFWR